VKVIGPALHLVKVIGPGLHLVCGCTGHEQNWGSRRVAHSRP